MIHDDFIFPLFAFSFCLKQSTMILEISLTSFFASSALLTLINQNVLFSRYFSVLGVILA